MNTPNTEAAPPSDFPAGYPDEFGSNGRSQAGHRLWLIPLVIASASLASWTALSRTVTRERCPVGGELEGLSRYCESSDADMGTGLFI